MCSYRQIEDEKTLRSVHTAHFLYSLWISEQTAIISLYNINWLFISIFNQLDAQNLFHNKFYFMPHMYHHTYRCDDTRGCVMQFWPPDDEHMCSKHVETWNKLIVKQILCIKLVKYWDKYTEMHGQQNVKINWFL